MNRPEQLHERLDAIGRSLESSGKALALIGLGSLGVETARADRYSDLDFYAVVRPGHKAELLRDLRWMSAAHPVAWCFQNTPHGYKLLYEDGIFCELEVYEPEDLPKVRYAEGRFVWKARDCDASLRIPAQEIGDREERSVAWNVGELVTNLYVGLCRYRRGEKLSAYRFVQGYAVDRVMELLPHIRTPEPVHRDPFGRERRIEQQYPDMTADFASFMQGYERTPESALSLLRWVERYFEVNPAMRRLVEELCLR
ncbi:hypothetical protein [Sorangium sp. So ce394]|uniref:hypothetical protein n=1 Tax=Sorangium sp. So ce394 TaxID=3133310 RepID=UPI003F5C1E08